MVFCDRGHTLQAPDIVKIIKKTVFFKIAMDICFFIFIATPS